MSRVLIRKVVEYVEDIHIEGGREAERPLRQAVCAAVIRNPWSDAGFIEDLQPEILAHSKVLSETLVPRLIKLMGGAERIEAFGKAAATGSAGEIEHAAGLIHTLHFGNAYRIGANGDSFLPFTNTRIGMGGAIHIPMTHKLSTKKGTRSHFLTVVFNMPDGPSPDEIIVALGAADGGRPHHRIGDRFKDMQSMGVDQTGQPIMTD